MLKFLVFIVLFSYIIFKGLGMLFRLLSGTSGNVKQQPHGYDGYQTRKPRDGNVNIDYMPEKDGKSRKKGFRGGEYVDYEEVN